MFSLTQIARALSVSKSQREEDDDDDDDIAVLVNERNNIFLFLLLLYYSHAKYEHKSYCRLFLYFEFTTW